MASCCHTLCPAAAKLDHCHGGPPCFPRGPGEKLLQRSSSCSKEGLWAEAYSLGEPEGLPEAELRAAAAAAAAAACGGCGCACAGAKDFHSSSCCGSCCSGCCSGCCSSSRSQSHLPSDRSQLLQLKDSAKLCCCQHHCPHHHPLAAQLQLQQQEVEVQASSAAAAPLLLQQHGEAVEYEYYVWDAAAQEYVQTDQQTGEHMLRDPQYFQYHYRLVENPQDGEALLLPEPLAAAAAAAAAAASCSAAAAEEASSEAPRAHAGTPSLCREQLEEDCSSSSSAINEIQEEAELLQTPESLLTPQQQQRWEGAVAAACRGGSGCSHLQRSSLQLQQQQQQQQHYHHHHHVHRREPPEKENCTQAACRGRHSLSAHSSRWAAAAAPGAAAAAAAACSRWRKPKGLSPKLEGAAAASATTTAAAAAAAAAGGGGDLHARFFISCSRPWENSSASLRDRDLQLRKLRHLQRVQQLEKEELLRRQMVLDEMAAALPKAAQQLVHAEAAETAAAAAAGRTGKEGSRGCGISSSRSAPRRPNCLAAQGLYQEADKRFRTDPVSRGRYFRDKWKSDKFLEQQRHPAFDVKAYDAWLKNRGHLIRGRALELQQEEQRLISQLQLQQQQQQQRGGRPRRFGL